MDANPTECRSFASQHAGIGLSVGVKNLTKRFGRHPAVDDASIEVAPGEFVSLLGPSGSGKSTLLMSIAGLERPDSGDVYINGIRITDTVAQKRNVGVVFQKHALFPHMTVAQNLAFPLRMRGIASGDISSRVSEALGAMRLSGFEGRFPSQLSGGESQRVALARALIYRPAVLLMDEPLGALDRKLRDEIQIELKELQRRLLATIIFVTHDQAEALTLSDRVALLDRGRIVQIGTPRDLYERPQTRFVASFVGEANFFDGELIGAGTDVGTVRLASGKMTDGILTGAKLATGAPVSVAIRPEHVERAPGRNPGFVGRIADIRYAGDTLTYVLRAADGTICLMRAGPYTRSEPYALDDELGISWDPARALIFLRESVGRPP